MNIVLEIGLVEIGNMYFKKIILFLIKARKIGCPLVLRQLRLMSYSSAFLRACYYQRVAIEE